MKKILFSKYKIWIAAFLTLFIIVLSVSIAGYRIVLASNFFPSQTVYVYIDKETTFENLCSQLDTCGNARNMNTFRMLSGWMGFPKKGMRPGRYAVMNGMTNWELINEMRRGHQTPLRMTFNNIRLKKDLLERLDQQLMLDSAELGGLLADSAYCAGLGFTTETVPLLFIPNTYEVYWNISAEKLIVRMKKEYDAYWNEQRRRKAESIGLTPVEVGILASIVEEESAVADELPVIAGLYLNRLHRNIPLQADPTVKYAVGDFTLQRILNKHLEVDSPYNTYKYPGLPPGPLRLPSIRGLEAVLNYAHHNYLYMCAKEDFSGRHNFAASLAAHSRNAARYRMELDKRRIR